MADHRWPGPLVVAVTATLILVGCSSAPAAPATSADSLAVGSAKVSIASADETVDNAVSCRMLGGGHTSIAIGDKTTGIDVVLDTADGVHATSVTITNVEGFTGSYWQDLQGEATASMTGKVVTVSGTARGFATDAPCFVVQKPFHIRAAC